MGLGPITFKPEDVLQPGRDLEVRLQGFRAAFPQYDDMDAETLVGRFGKSIMVIWILRRW